MKYTNIALAILFFSIVLILSFGAMASPSPYTKVAIAYNFSSQNAIENSTRTHKEYLYSGDNISYSVEAGLSVPTEENNALHLGVYWYDLLNQGESAKMHRPYRFEIFSDYVWQWDDFMFVKIGAGYKIFEETQIYYQNNDQTYINNIGTNPVIDKISARLAIGRHFGKYSLSLEHHSQWLKGKPFSDEWEYHVTNINLAYTF